LLAPVIGVDLSVLLVGALELFMATEMTAFGVAIAGRIEKMESFQVVMQMLLMPMLFLSRAVFAINGQPASMVCRPGSAP